MHFKIFFFRLRASLRPHKPSFGIKIILSCFIKGTQWRISAEKAWTQLFLRLTLLNMHCRSFTFRCKIYGRRVFKWITQRILLTFALVKLLVFAPLFNAQIKHVLNYFALEMAAIVARRRHCRVQRARGRRERIFSTCINLFRRQEEHIVQTYRLPSHAIFNLLQEKKTTRSHAIPSLSKLLANLNFLSSGCFQHTVASSFLYSLFATTLICAALGILRWSICKWDVASVFFNLHVVSKSPAEISTPIGALLELCSRANLPCLVKLALSLNLPLNKLV